MTNDEIKIVIREVRAEDHHFILATWLKGNYFGNPYFRLMPQELYFEEYARYLTECVLSPLHPEGRAEIQIACDERNPSWVVGFSVSRSNTLYWIYVKRDYRRRGIARLLISQKPISTVKAMTKVGRVIADKHRLIFNPL